MATKKTIAKATKSDIPYEYKPSLYLDDKQSKKMKDMPVGKKVKMIVHATVQSQSQNQYNGEPTRHSTNLQIDKMMQHKPKKK